MKIRGTTENEVEAAAEICNAAIRFVDQVLPSGRHDRSVANSIDDCEHRCLIQGYNARLAEPQRVAALSMCEGVGPSCKRVLIALKKARHH